MFLNLMILAAVTVALFWLFAARRGSRFARCPHCRAPLQNADAPRCPACGEHF